MLLCFFVFLLLLSISTSSSSSSYAIEDPCLPRTVRISCLIERSKGIAITACSFSEFDIQINRTLFVDFLVLISGSDKTQIFIASSTNEWTIIYLSFLSGFNNSREVWFVYFQFFLHVKKSLMFLCMSSTNSKTSDCIHRRFWSLEYECMNFFCK